MVDMHLVMTLLVPVNMLCSVWSYDLYDTTLSIEQQTSDDKLILDQNPYIFLYLLNRNKILTKGHKSVES